MSEMQWTRTYISRPPIPAISVLNLDNLHSPKFYAIIQLCYAVNVLHISLYSVSSNAVPRFSPTAGDRSIDVILPCVRKIHAAWLGASPQTPVCSASAYRVSPRWSPDRPR